MTSSSQRPRLRAVLFDLDGTLIDSLADIGHAMNRALVEHGCPSHPLEAYKKFVGEGIRNLVLQALPAESAGMADAILKTYRALYTDSMFDQTRPYPGVVDALKELARRRLTLAVLSNKIDPSTKALVRHFFADLPFKAAYGDREGIPRKPNPQSALGIAEELGIPAAECAFVGDTSVDMKTAVAAGMFPIGVTWGFRDEAELRAAGAGAIAHTAAELIALFD